MNETTTYTKTDEGSRYAGDYKSLKLNTELDKHKADHSHEENMARMGIDQQLREKEIEAEIDLEKYKYRKKIGWLGVVFGGVESASKNITAIICVLILIGMIWLSVCAYDCDNGISKIKDIWGIGTPILTLSLGYLFGKN